MGRFLLENPKIVREVAIVWNLRLGKEKKSIGSQKRRKDVQIE